MTQSSNTPTTRGHSEGPLEVYEISRFELEDIIEKNPSLQKTEDCYEYRVQDTIKKQSPDPALF